MFHKTAVNFLSPVLPFLPCKKAITGMWVKKESAHASIEGDVKCMQSNFGGRGLSCFGDKVSF